MKLVAESLILVIAFINVLLPSYNMRQLPKSSLGDGKNPIFELVGAQDRTDVTHLDRNRRGSDTGLKKKAIPPC